MSRFSNSRSSIKLPGLKISPLPDTHTKRPLVIEPICNCVATTHIPPLKLEQASTFLQKSPKHTTKVLEQKAKVVLYAGDLTCAVQYAPKVLGKVDKNPNLDLRLAWILTVPKRTVVLATYIAVTEYVPEIKEVPANYSLPAKEYPYYSPHRTVLLGKSYDRAIKEPDVEVSWFFTNAPQQRKSSNAAASSQLVSSIAPVSSTKVERKPFAMPGTHNFCDDNCNKKRSNIFRPLLPFQTHF